MNLRPRHYVLILILFALGIFNFWRRRHVAPAPILAVVPQVTRAARAETPAWAAFDRAAALRDAPDSEFQPALSILRGLTSSDPGKADLNGCVTWLDFYRQGVLHPSRDPQWKERSERHLNGCVKFHLDTTAA